MTGKALLVLLLAPWGLAAEMKLFVLAQETERAITESYDIGTVAPKDFLDTSFRVRNSSASAAWLEGLNIAGSGFSFTTLPALPIELASGATADFVVRFNPAETGLLQRLSEYQRRTHCSAGNGQSHAFTRQTGGNIRDPPVERRYG